MKKQETAITLIALVITIIILIILAGVSINMLVGENGIITQAQKAKENTQIAQEEEQKNLNRLDEQIENEGMIVVKIGDKAYTSIQKAVNSIQSSTEVAKITLLENIKENLVVATDKKIEIDLNSKTWQGYIKNNGMLSLGNGVLETDQDIANIENSGTLTIRSGKIERLGQNGTSIISTGTLNIEGGNIISNGICILINDGSLKMTGGEILNTDENASAAANARRGQALEINKGTVLLEGGTIISMKGRAIGNHGTVTINGANISSGASIEQFSNVLSTVCNFYNAEGEETSKITLLSGNITNTYGGYAVSAPLPTIFENKGGTVTGKIYQQ